MKLRVKLIESKNVANGMAQIHGNVIGEDGKPMQNGHVAITGPRGGLNLLDPDKVHVFEITPEPEAPAV